MTTDRTHGFGRSMVAAAATFAAFSAGCGSSATDADCFSVWNARDNAARRTQVAGRFSVADVAEWTAQPANGDGASHGCGYLFHDRRHYVSFSWERTNGRGWGVPPTQRGTWSAQQQAAVRDNAHVRRNGSLERR